MNIASVSFLLHFNQLCVEVYDNTCDDRNDKNSVNREQDGTDLSNRCDGNNVPNPAVEMTA